MLLLTYHYGHLKVHLFRDEATHLLSVRSDDGDELFNPVYIPGWSDMRGELLRLGFTLE